MKVLAESYMKLNSNVGQETIPVDLRGVTAQSCRTWPARDSAVLWNAPQLERDTAPLTHACALEPPARGEQNQQHWLTTTFK